MKDQKDILCPELCSILNGQDATYENLYTSFVEYCNRIDGQIHLVGLPLGGIIAMNYALDFPEKVKTLVIIGTPHKIPKVAFEIQNVIFQFFPKSVFKEMAFDKIKQFTKVQFLHWTEEEFSSCFRKMLTLEQYREPQMAQLYQNYLASGPLTYMEALFSGMLGDAGKARQTALDFYGPIFLLYSIYDGAEDKSHVIKLLEEHMDHFLQEMQTS